MMAITTNNSTNVKPCSGWERLLRFPAATCFLWPLTRRTLLCCTVCTLFIGVDLHKFTIMLTAVEPVGEKRAQLKISTKSTAKNGDWCEEWRLVA